MKENRGGVMGGKNEQLAHVGERQRCVSEGKSKVKRVRWRRFVPLLARSYLDISHRSLFIFL